MTAKPNYPDSLCFTRAQDEEIKSTQSLAEINQLARSWNLHENSVRGRLTTLRAYYRRTGEPIANFKKSKSVLPLEPRLPVHLTDAQPPRPRPSRFARPAFFEENLTQLTKGAI
jgi:hypothetical protein